jgi:hypothetical protein
MMRHGLLRGGSLSPEALLSGNALSYAHRARRNPMTVRTLKNGAIAVLIIGAAIVAVAAVEQSQINAINTRLAVNSAEANPANAKPAARTLAPAPATDWVVTEHIVPSPTLGRFSVSVAEGSVAVDVKEDLTGRYVAKLFVREPLTGNKVTRDFITVSSNQRQTGNVRYVGEFETNGRWYFVFEVLP